jgi:hypothetical protein
MLYDGAGTLIPASSLAANLSTTYNDAVESFLTVPAVATYCIDGALLDRQQCATAAYDPDPRLTIAYPCSGGRTLGSLSMVKVYNRVADKDDPCGLSCRTRIKSFAIDFLDPSGQVDASRYVFDDGYPLGQAVYTILLEEQLEGAACV